MFEEVTRVAAVWHFLGTHSASCCIFIEPAGERLNHTMLLFLSAKFSQVWCGSVWLSTATCSVLTLHRLPQLCDKGQLNMPGPFMTQTLYESDENVWKWCSYRHFVHLRFKGINTTWVPCENQYIDPAQSIRPSLVLMTGQDVNIDGILGWTVTFPPWVDAHFLIHSDMVGGCSTVDRK